MCKKSKFTLLAVAPAFAFTSARAMGQASTGANLDPKPTFVGGTLICTLSSPPTIHVPPELMEQAKVKARLAVLLRQSLYDDATGIVNVAREKEIRKLANKLLRGENE